MAVADMAAARWRYRMLVSLLVLMAGSAPAQAVNKCVGTDGRVTYTDGPCGSGSRVTRVDTPPPLSREEQMEAMSRSDSLVREARALEARQLREAAERRRLDEELRQVEVQRQRLEREESERQARMAAVPMYSAPIYPVYPRYRPPVVVPPALRPAPAAPPALMRSYPFR